MAAAVERSNVERSDVERSYVIDSIDRP